MHLEHMQNVTFKDNDHLQCVLSRPNAKQTSLTEWLRNNRNNEYGQHLRYIDYLSEYRWDGGSKCWIRRTSNRTPSIGRLIYIHPTAGEAFYLRMLLSHQIGCRSFEDIRTVSGEVHDTYRAACEHLGLLQDDNEWSTALEEASGWATASELRSLFTHMLLYCEISNPKQLFNAQWEKMADDAAYIHLIVNADDKKQCVI